VFAESERKRQRLLGKGEFSIVKVAGHIEK
jgi:hypothetical protein